VIVRVVDISRIIKLSLFKLSFYSCSNGQRLAS